MTYLICIIIIAWGVYTIARNIPRIFCHIFRRRRK